MVIYWDLVATELISISDLRGHQVEKPVGGPLIDLVFRMPYAMSSWVSNARVPLSPVG